MSFARSFMSLAPSARFAATRLPPVSRTSILLARRSISNSSARPAQVDPLLNHNHSHGHLAGPVEPRSPPPKTATFTAADEPGKNIDLYKDGPGALEKAVSLFFFTEILRGMSILILTLRESRR